MKQKEKLVIAISLSLGFMFVPNPLYPLVDADSSSAGICGVIRTIELAGLGSANYTGKSHRSCPSPSFLN